MVNRDSVFRWRTTGRTSCAAVDGDGDDESWGCRFPLLPPTAPAEGQHWMVFDLLFREEREGAGREEDG